MSRAKWKGVKYDSPPKSWKSPQRVYPCADTEADALRGLRDTFAPLPIYAEMEAEGLAADRLVSLEIPIPDGHIAFLENTAEKCTCPETKHSEAGMQGARHWVQRVALPREMFRRLTDGYGISLMFGERNGQYIRNAHNWRGASGVMLDIDVFREDPDSLRSKAKSQGISQELLERRLAENEKKPKPCYSREELLERYPLIPKIVTFLLPSASSLYEGRPYKARGVVLFPEAITDMRVYRAFGKALLEEVNCIPANVTKNPLAVGFGNTHNAPQSLDNAAADARWVEEALDRAKDKVIAEAKARKQKAKERGKLRAHYEKQRSGSRDPRGDSGENISTFIETCDPVREMCSRGWLTHITGDVYQWHTSESQRSCTIHNGVIKPFSQSMVAVSPDREAVPVNAHRFYLYVLAGLDISNDADKSKARQALYEMGYGSDPVSYVRTQQEKGIRKPVKLCPDSPYAGVLETLAKARGFLDQVFQKASGLFAIRTDTGTGKTEKPMTYAVDYQTVLTVQTTALATDVERRSVEHGVKTFRYRGIESDDKSGGYFPCIHKARFVAIRDKGFNPYKTVCSGCEVRELCETDGYLSQPDKARKAKLVAMPFTGAFLDPRFRSFAKLYKPRGKHALIFHDDIPIGSLFIEVKLTASRLRRIAQDWQDTAPAEWADILLECLVKRNWDVFKAACFPDADTTDHVRQAFREVLDPFSKQIVKAKDYILSSRVDISTVEACEKLPVVDTENFDTLSALQAFWKRYPRVADAPFYYDTASESWTFYLPPSPWTDSRKTLRVGFGSATADKRLYERIFPEIDFHDAAMTEWAEGAEFYQLRTNRNPRATVLDREQTDGKWKDKGLTTTGNSYYQAVVDFIKANPDDKHAVISYKDVIAEKQTELGSLDVVCGHFGGIAGLDTDFKGVRYFHVLFCPFVSPLDIDMLAKKIYGNDEKPLGRDTDGNLSRDATGTYEDERPQAIVSTLVTAELIQAIGRARLNLYPNAVILWTSHFIDGVSNREGVVLFDETDWATAGNDLETLRGVVASREAKEEETEQAIADGDVKAVAKLAGVSERQARSLTVGTRKQSKVRRDAEICRRYHAGETQTQIAKHMKLERGIVYRVIKKQAF